MPTSARTRETREVKPGTFIDPLTTIRSPFWTQGYDLTPANFDQMSVVNGYVTHSNPDQGPIPGANAAAHGCAFHNFGSDYLTDFEIEITWSGIRPCEATPLLHVDTSTARYGLGVWPIYNFSPGNYPPVSAHSAGYIGNSNLTFEVDAGASDLLDAGELNKFGKENPYLPGFKPHRGGWSFVLRSSEDLITCRIDGVWTGVGLVIPAAHRTSSTHGFAIDNNQTSTTTAYGGPRPANAPAMTGPFILRKL